MGAIALLITTLNWHSENYDFDATIEDDQLIPEILTNKYVNRQTCKEILSNRKLAVAIGKVRSFNFTLILSGIFTVPLYFKTLACKAIPCKTKISAAAAAIKSTFLASTRCH